MYYTIKVTEAKNRNEGNENQRGCIRGFATVVFGNSFKISNIAILENKKKGELFVSMPRYKSGEKGVKSGAVYKDICNPITKEFRKELYGNILEAFENAKTQVQEQEQGHGQMQTYEKQSGKGLLQDGIVARSIADTEMPKFSVSVAPYEREGSNIRGLARIYLEDCFIINNVSILQGKENVFVAMPAYKTNQTGEGGKAVYQDVCYPVTKEFREKLFSSLISMYEKEFGKKQEQITEQVANNNQVLQLKCMSDMPVAEKTEFPFR